MGTDISEEDLKKFQQKTNIKQLMRGGNQQGENTITQEILAQDQYKQDVMDGLLGIRREKLPWRDDETGEIYLQEFIKLEDGTGRWKRPDKISDEQWEKIKEGGMITEEGAKDILNVLNSISNNNVALSNLTKDTINQVARNAMFAIDYKLRSNKNEYGLESTEEIEQIMHTIIIPNIMAALNKAKNGSLMAEILRDFKIVGSLDEEDDDSNPIPGFD